MSPTERHRDTSCQHQRPKSSVRHTKIQTLWGCPHPQNTPVLPRAGEGLMSPLKCLGPHQLWMWDMGQQNRWSLPEISCWKSCWTEADRMQHTQQLHVRLAPLCHQVTLSSPSPPGPGRDSRFPNIWNFCCAISFGSKGKLVHFPWMFWHWDVPNSGTGASMCSLHLPDASSCAWQHFQKEEHPGASAVTARLCHIPCLSSLSRTGFPSSLPASVC